MNGDLNILKWYDSIDKQEHRKWYFYDTIPILPVEINQLPPFQLVRPKTGAQITRFDLVNFKTGVVTDVLSSVAAGGLQVLESSNKTYDIVYYPATVRIASPIFDQGGYYAVMSDGVNTWYSEVFTMKNYLGDHIKIEWCHARDFDYPGGHIQYTSSGYGNGFKNYLWVDTDIAKPQYIYEREVVNRDGQVFPRKQIRKKQYRFDYIGPESLLDVISIIELHDDVKIYDKNGNTLEVNEFEISEPEWSQQGNLAALTVTFVTDKVIVPIYGNGTSVGICEVAAGTCIPSTGSFYVVKSHILINGPEWLMGYYFDQNGNKTNLSNGDYVTAGSGGTRRLYQYNSPDDFTVIDLLGFYTKIWYENTNEYWYDRGESLHIRKSEIRGHTNLTSPPTFYGQTGNDDGAIYELWLEDAGGGQTFVRQTTNTVLGGIGEQIETDGFAFSVLKTVTVKCGVIMEEKFEIPLDYLLFTIDDDDFTYVLTTADDNTDYLLGDQDIPSIPVP